VDVYIGQFYENYRSNPNLLVPFSMVQAMHIFLRIMCWITSWAIFSQTHLVTGLLVSIFSDRNVLVFPLSQARI
jgi:hypothetical protein